MKLIVVLSTSRKRCEDDTIYEFIKRRFGSELADYAIDPLVRGICAGDAREISAGNSIRIVTTSQILLKDNLSRRICCL